MGKPHINILTRTSNRRDGFEICAMSVRCQSYENMSHIVCYDNPEDLGYIDLHDVQKVWVDRQWLIDNDKSEDPNDPSFWHSPHNLYCNVLMDHVSDGYIMFLDDDDMLISDGAIERIVENIVDEDTILIWQMRCLNGNLLPTDGSFLNEELRLGNIGSPCFLFHCKWKDCFRWDAYKCGDFRFLEKLYGKIPNHRWINEPFVQLNNEGGFGRRMDIESDVVASRKEYPPSRLQSICSKSAS